MKKIVSILVLCFCLINVVCQQKTQGKQDLSNNKTTRDSCAINYFIAYGLGEMAFNQFQNFSGEIGLRFKNQHMLRFVYNNIKATEKHLSSNFANAVDGHNVRGLLKSYDLIYNIPVYKGIYAGALGGYVNDYYEHTELDESVEHFSPTLGFSVGYRDTNLFKVKGLYYYFELPFRFYLNPLEETKLGDSTVNRHFFVNNIWFFIGFQF
ncbi:hypothetical protein [Saccharicrinis aurantiacus]|uniref:hypothetical protein n=1 Tax=Saccharicrinis aurantiacus TaxID=1849719 RepID=UPI002492C4C7|nr:hypothetical protein [Saccharicrinis aurantiacus]